MLARAITGAVFALVLLAGGTTGRAFEGTAPPAPKQQTQATADAKSAGCMSCHTETDSLTMHTSPGVTLGCADCHGGDPSVVVSKVFLPGSAEYRRALDAAHVQPRNLEA